MLIFVSENKANISEIIYRVAAPTIYPGIETLIILQTKKYKHSKLGVKLCHFCNACS